MSSVTRRVGFYSIDLRNGNGIVNFSEIEFENLLNAIVSLDKIERKIIISENKFYFLDELRISDDTGTKIFQCIFKSAKTHHKPPLINEDNLDERANPKEETEGECEKTHIAFKVINSSIIAVLEERKSGVGFSRIFSYLQDMVEKLDIDYNGTMFYNVIVKDNFINELDNLLKISKITLTRDIQYSGTEFLNFNANPQNFNDMDKEVITYTAKRSKNIKMIVRNIFLGLNENISNVRIEGGDEFGKKILNLSELRKTASFNMDIDPITHTVNSDIILRKLKEYISDM